MLDVNGVPMIRYAPQEDLTQILDSLHSLLFSAERRAPLVTQKFSTIEGQQWCTEMTIHFAVPKLEQLDV